MRASFVLCAAVLLAAGVVTAVRADGDGAGKPATKPGRPSAVAGAQMPAGGLEPVTVEGDLVVDKPVSYKGKHLKIRGNLILARGGVLTLEDSTCELLCTYSREFLVQWRGGTLRTRNATIGGSDHKGFMAQTNFELHDGLWEATDTTVRMSYGIVFSEKTVGRLRAKGLKAGVCPDSVILGGRGDAIVEDSEFQFSLNLTAAKGGTTELDLRIKEPVSRVFDGKILRDPEARLELRNVTVPSLWWVFVHDVKMDGPPREIVLSGNANVIPGIMGWNLKGPMPFAVNLPEPFRAGPLTIRRGKGDLTVQNMSYYLSGPETDVTVPGPTTLNEVMVWGGRMSIHGTPGTHDVIASCTSFDVHGDAELSIANAALGIPRTWGNWKGLGQITASDKAHITVRDSAVRKIQLITKGGGAMTLSGCRREEDVFLREQGGAIRFEDSSTKPDVAPGTQSASPTAQQLWVYPAPGQDEYRSQHYRVSIEQGGKVQESFCYQTRSIWHHEFPEPWEAKSFPKEDNWVNFSFAGKVTVVVEPLNVKVIGVELAPDPQGVKGAVDAGKIRVEITRPGQYYVMVKAKGDQRHDFDHPLFIFANPPETQVPAKGAPKVHYFGPGVHDIGFQYRVKAGETVYIAGGAMVKGSLYYDGDGVKILGRGILTDRKLMLERVKSALAEKAAGKKLPWDLNHDKMYRDKWATILGEATANGALIDGITIIESPFYMVRTHGAGTVFRNLKLMGDLYNNNGIIGGTKHKILNCFLKVEDDVFCWMAPISETRNCVIWKQDNACLVQLGYGYGYATRGHVFADNCVIVDTTHTQVMARGLFGLASSIGTTFTDCRIENLKVYGDVLNFLAIDNWDRPTPWSAKPDGEVKLRPIKLHFKNVEITGTEKGTYWGADMEDLKGTPMRSRLRTEKEGTIHIILENVRMNGKRLRSDADWPNGLLKQGQVTVEYR